MSTRVPLRRREGRDQERGQPGGGCTGREDWWFLEPPQLEFGVYTPGSPSPPVHASAAGLPGAALTSAMRGALAQLSSYLLLIKRRRAFALTCQIPGLAGMLPSPPVHHTFYSL